MFRAATIGLLMLATAPLAAQSAVGPDGIDDTMALLRQEPAPEAASVNDCDASNVLRRLSGCSALIKSGEVRGRALSRAYRNRGMALFSLGEKRRAIGDFDKAVRYDDGNAALYLARGTAWQHLGEHARAVKDLDRTIEIDPKNAAAYGNLGVAWEKLGDDDRALKNYDRSLEFEPRNAIVLNNRGNVLVRLGERGRAIQDYDRALSIDPKYASAYYNRAGELCLQGAAASAVEDYLHAIRLGERQRSALQDFLSRQGYYKGPAAPASAIELEGSLWRWSKHACIAVPAAKATTSGAAANDGATRRDRGAS